MNSLEIFCEEFKYPTIIMLNTAVKMQINGLLASGMVGYLIYLKITKGRVIIIAMNPIIKNINPISWTPCTFDVIAHIVIPTNTIQ